MGPRLCLAVAWAAWIIKPILNRNDEGPGFYSRAFFLVPSHELSLFLLREDRLPVFLAGQSSDLEPRGSCASATSIQVAAILAMQKLDPLTLTAIAALTHQQPPPPPRSAQHARSEPRLHTIRYLTQFLRHQLFRVKDLVGSVERSFSVVRHAFKRAVAIAKSLQPGRVRGKKAFRAE